MSVYGGYPTYANVKPVQKFPGICVPTVVTRNVMSAQNSILTFSSPRNLWWITTPCSLDQTPLSPRGKLLDHITIPTLSREIYARSIHAPMHPETSIFFSRICYPLGSGKVSQALFPWKSRTWTQEKRFPGFCPNQVSFFIYCIMLSTASNTSSSMNFGASSHSTTHHLTQTEGLKHFLSCNIAYTKKPKDLGKPSPRWLSQIQFNKSGSWWTSCGMG